MRRKMNQIIKWLETDGFDAHKEQITSDKYSKALKALIDAGCVKAIGAWGGDIVSLTLLGHYATYQLERHDVWINRLWGFLAGVTITVVAELLLRAIL